MRILDRYILKSALSIFLSCIFTFLFLYVIIDIVSNLEDIILKHRVNIFVLIEYYLNYLPIMFVQVSPFASLLSTLYTFGKLNQNNEIIAMRSSGLSIFQISKTVIIMGLLISLVVFWINDRVLPRSLLVTQKIREQMVTDKKKEKEKKQEIFNNLCMYGMKNRLFFINKFSSATNTMEGIIVLEHDEYQNLTKKIVAVKGIYQEGLWRFYQSITYNFDANGQVIQEPIFFEEEIMAIPETPHDFVSQRQRPDFMTTAQLDDYIWKLSKSGASTVIRGLKIDLYQRFASPFTNFVIILIGIPFSLMMRKRATGLSSIGLSIMVGFFYYIIDAIIVAFGRGGLMMPALAVSLTHIIGLAFALYLINTSP